MMLTGVRVIWNWPEYPDWNTDITYDPKTAANKMHHSEFDFAKYLISGGGTKMTIEYTDYTVTIEPQYSH